MLVPLLHCPTFWQCGAPAGGILLPSSLQDAGLLPVRRLLPALALPSLRLPGLATPTMHLYHGRWMGTVFYTASCAAWLTRSRLRGGLRYVEVWVLHCWALCLPLSPALHPAWRLSDKLKCNTSRCPTAYHTFPAWHCCLLWVLHWGCFLLSLPIAFPFATTYVPTCSVADAAF